MSSSGGSGRPRGGSGRPGGGSGKNPQPSLRPTAPLTVIVCFGAAAALGLLLAATNYALLPKLRLISAISLVVLAVLEFLLARSTRARIARKPGTQPVEPLVVARLVALAKASTIAGSLVAGGFGGIAIWLLSQRATLAAAGADLPGAIGGLVGGALLAAAGIYAEHSCRIPDDDDDDDQGYA